MKTEPSPGRKPKTSSSKKKETPVQKRREDEENMTDVDQWRRDMREEIDMTEIDLLQERDQLIREDTRIDETSMTGRDHDQEDEDKDPDQCHRVIAGGDDKYHRPSIILTRQCCVVVLTTLY